MFVSLATKVLTFGNIILLGVCLFDIIILSLVGIFFAFSLFVTFDQYIFGSRQGFTHAFLPLPNNFDILIDNGADVTVRGRNRLFLVFLFPNIDLPDFTYGFFPFPSINLLFLKKGLLATLIILKLLLFLFLHSVFFAVNNESVDSEYDSIWLHAISFFFAATFLSVIVTDRFRQVTDFSIQFFNFI